MTPEAITIDANGPMAGKALEMEVTVLEVEPKAASLQTADFAGGCFWGELEGRGEGGVHGSPAPATVPTIATAPAPAATDHPRCHHAKESSWRSSGSRVWS